MKKEFTIPFPHRQLDPAKAEQYLKSEVMRKLVEEFRESEDSDRAAQCLSMAYLLMSMGNYYAEKCVGLIAKHHLQRGKIKTRTNNLMQSFDTWDSELFAIIGKPENANAFCNDNDLLIEILDTFLTDHIEVERGVYFKPKLFLPLKQ